MYCKNCGNETVGTELYCKSCGAKQKIIDKNPGFEYEKDESESFDPNKEDAIHGILKRHRIFFDKNENTVSILGSGFLSSIIAEGKFRKSILICSDKRIYQKGKIFERDHKGDITYNTGQKCVNLV